MNSLKIASGWINNSGGGVFMVALRSTLLWDSMGTGRASALGESRHRTVWIREEMRVHAGRRDASMLIMDELRMRHNAGKKSSNCEAAAVELRCTQGNNSGIWQRLSFLLRDAKH